MDQLAASWVGDDATPFQIGLLGLFDASSFRRPDGALDVLRIRREITARASRVPSLQRQVVWTRLFEGRPFWAVDPAFHPASQIGYSRVPGGADPETWVANRSVRPLDLRRPLWRAEVIDGLTDDRFGVLVLLHHILADGLGGVALAAALLDSSEDVEVRHAPQAQARQLPSRRDRIEQRIHEIRHRPKHTPRQRSESAPRHPVAQFRDAVAQFRAPLQRTSLPTRVTSARRLVTIREDLGRIRNTGRCFGVTVNDMLLAAVTGGLRELLASRGEDLTDLILRTTIPVAMGTGAQVMTMMVVDLPVCEPDPLRQLALLHAATSRKKEQLRSAGGEASDVLQIPVTLARPLVKWGRRFGSKRINLAVSNVPGPAAPVWLAGARMVEAVPVSPLVPFVPLSVAALSYAGSLQISVNADAAISDLDVLRAGISSSFTLLADRAATGPSSSA